MLQVVVNIQEDKISPIQDIGVYVGNIAAVILTVAGIAAFIYLVYGGLRWILAGSDAGKVEEAREQITNALIGLAVAAVAWAIFLLADFFFGLDIAGQQTNLDVVSGASGATSSTSTTCGGGLKLNQVAELNGVEYRCVNAGTACGSDNPNGFSYPFNCPVKCAGDPTADCSDL